MSAKTADLLTLASVREMAKSGRARLIREEAGLTMSEMAKALGIGISTLSRWEQGQRAPRGKAALDYAAVLSELQLRGTRR